MKTSCALALLLACPFARGEPVELPDRAFGVPCLFRVHPAIREASGAALILEKDGARFYWSHGDSDTGTVLGRTDLATLRTERIQLAASIGGQPVKNVDWESMSPDGEGNLWIVDGGGNNSPRPSITAYAVNPRDPARPLPVTRRVEIVWPNDANSRTNSAAERRSTPPLVSNLCDDADQDFRAPPDIEATFILNGSLFLIEKTFGGFVRVFHADLAPTTTGGPSTKISARLIGLLSPTANRDATLVPISAITDASLCDGQVFLLTYLAVFRLPAAEFVKAAEAHAAIIGRDAVELVCPLVGRAGVVTQAEGIAALAPDEFLLSREDGRVFRWRNGAFEKPAGLAASRTSPAPR